MKWGAVGILAAVSALGFVTLGWGTELTEVSLVDLSDRDAVVLEVGRSYHRNEDRAAIGRLLAYVIHVRRYPRKW